MRSGTSASPVHGAMAKDDTKMDTAADKTEEKETKGVKDSELVPEEELVWSLLLLKLFPHSLL